MMVKEQLPVLSLRDVALIVNGMAVLGYDADEVFTRDTMVEVMMRLGVYGSSSTTTTTATTTIITPTTAANLIQGVGRLSASGRKFPLGYGWTFLEAIIPKTM